MLQITSYGVICAMFTDNLMKYIGYLEIVVGLGASLGPALGSLLVALVQYDQVMYTFASTCLIALSLCYCYIPNELNITATEAEMAELELLEEEQEGQDENKKEKLKIGWCTVLSNKCAMMALGCIYMGAWNGNFWSPFIESYFQLMGNEHVAGIAQLAMGAFYLGTCFIIPYTCEKAPRRLTFVLTFIGFGFVNMFLGPSEIVGLYDSPWSRKCEPADLCTPANFKNTVPGYAFNTRIYVVATAQALVGFFQVFVFIPIIPEMIERIQDKLQVAEGKDEVIDNAINDKVNDSYGFVFALAQLMSPLVGSAIYSSGGEETETMDVAGDKAAMPRITDFSMLANFGFAIFLLIFNCGPFVISENREF